MRKFVVAACLASGAVAPGAYASDYAVSGSIGETLTASDNYFLLHAPRGTTYKSLTGGSLNFLRRTQDTRLLLDTNFSFYDYFGPGDVDTSPRNGTTGGAVFRVDHTTELNKYDFAASWQRSDVASTQLRESGIVTARGSLDQFSVRGGVTHDVSRSDSIGLSVGGSAVTFTDSTQSDYANVSAVGTWNHTISPTTVFSTSASLDWYDANDSLDSRRLFAQIITSLQTQLTHRLSVNGSIGGGFSKTYQDTPVTAFTPATQFQRGSDASVQAYLGLSYRLLKTTTVSLTAGHSIVPTTYGPIQTISTVGLGLSHTINDFSNLSLSTQFAHNDFAGLSSDLFSAQVAYGYLLTRELRARLSYTYSQRDDRTGFVQSSLFMVGLTYNFGLVGNPNADDDRAAERERARLRNRAVQALPGLF